MRKLKKILLFLGIVSWGSHLFSSQKPPLTCWQRVTSCFRPQLSSEDIDRARKETSLARISALQESEHVAPKKFVRAYTQADFSQASAILGENSIQDFYLQGQSEEHKVLIYKEGDVVKGVCVFKPADGHIYELSVGNSYKRKGVGSALVYAMMYDVKKNHNVNSLSVISGPCSKPFYESLDFKFMGGTGSVVFK